MAFWNEENVLELEVVVAQHCEYHLIVPFKMVNFMLYAAHGEFFEWKKGGREGVRVTQY